MFESVVGLDKAGTVAALAANEHTVTTGEVHRLRLAAHWADLHAGEAVDPAGLPGRERSVQPGGDGTPEVARSPPPIWVRCCRCPRAARPG